MWRTVLGVAKTFSGRWAGHPEDHDKEQKIEEKKKKK